MAAAVRLLRGHGVVMQVERACYEDLAFLVVKCNQQTHFSIICDFLRRTLDPLNRLFVQILRLSQKAVMVSLGHVFLYGSKVRTTASNPKVPHEPVLRERISCRMRSMP